jgi:nucleoside-diphosphate-sugar epimerase
MIASAFRLARSIKGSVIHAAGVSDSTCVRQSDFDRDQARLVDSLRNTGLFIYVSTCSVEDKPYTAHKRAMEELVRARGDFLILRLPTVAGRTANPHTLLNYLYARIVRSEGFDLYTRARRNIIDLSDVVAITHWLVRDGAVNETVNVAAPHDYSVAEIVNEFAAITGKHPHATRIDSGDVQDIDVTRISESCIDFSDNYLQRTLNHYYK